MKFKRVVAGGLAAAAALAVGVLLPSEASADVINGCPSDRFCAWEDSMYTGYLDIADLSVRLPKYTFGVSSYWNRTNLVLCAVDRDRTGVLTIRPGEQTALMPDGWNDRISEVTVSGLGKLTCG